MAAAARWEASGPCPSLLCVLCVYSALRRSRLRYGDAEGTVDEHVLALVHTCGMALLLINNSDRQQAAVLYICIRTCHFYY